MHPYRNDLITDVRPIIKTHTVEDLKRIEQETYDRMVFRCKNDPDVIKRLDEIKKEIFADLKEAAEMGHHQRSNFFGRTFNTDKNILWTRAVFHELRGFIKQIDEKFEVELNLAAREITVSWK